MGSHQPQHLMTYFVHGPDDDLFLRSKHVAFYIIKLVVLDLKVFSVILNTQLAHRDAYHKTLYSA